MKKTKIEWCDATWNPVTGCLHDCEYCYARGIAKRFGKTLPDYSGYPESHGGIHCVETKINDAPYPYNFEPTLLSYKLDELQKWTKPRNIFVCSMADLFGDWVPDEWITEVFEACRKAPQHNYLFLTKNYMRACEFRYEQNWWIGRTITHDEPCLTVNPNRDKNLYLGNGAPKSSEPEWKDHPNTFISIEPIHGPIPDLPYYAHEYGYKWVVVGAETGNRKGRVIPKREWIEKIVDDCKMRNVPVFMKDSLIPIVGEENMLREFQKRLRR